MKYEQKVIEIIKLETKDIVKLRKGDFGLVVGDIILLEFGYIDLDNYDDYLRDIDGDSEWDIVEIYVTQAFGYGTSDLIKYLNANSNQLKSVWRRLE